MEEDLSSIIQALSTLDPCWQYEIAYHIANQYGIEIETILDMIN